MLGFRFNLHDVVTIISELSDDNIFVLSDFDDDVCPAVDLLEISSFPYRTKTPPPDNEFVDTHEVYNPFIIYFT